MSRYIQVSDCSECPHLTHGGGFGKIAYRPQCGLALKMLPFDTYASREGMVVAHRQPGIPEWCPLPELK